jgi:monoterpene epsilon-lactone hydrolase
MIDIDIIVACVLPCPPSGQQADQVNYMASDPSAIASAAPTDAGNPRRRLRHEGAVEVGEFHLPYSAFASSAARNAFVTQINPPPPQVQGDILALRAHYETQNDRLADRMRALYPVSVREDEIGGVRVHRVTPGDPSPANAGRRLICLHGGAFAWGADSGALVEAIPIASVMGVEVIAVDYRLAPEHRFPAASIDVAAVYEALLARHAPGAIGVYGCSAGAILTAQALIWLAQSGLPTPGAIAMLGAGADELGGDSAWLAPSFEGYDPPTGDLLSLAGLDYFAGASADDPCVFPGRHPNVLGRFPPSLLIAGGRDFAASSVTRLHLDLDAVGVEARLYMFDGLWHAFQIYPDLPESRHVYRIMATFFDRHLAP